MATTLAAVQALFPTARYAPTPECKECGGTGVTPDFSEAWYAANPFAARVTRPCACVFFGPNADWMRDRIAKFINEATHG